MNTAEFLKENRDRIINSIKLELKRVEVVYDRKPKCTLVEAMVVYKTVLESTLNESKAKDEAFKAIKSGLKISACANLSEASMRQLPSSMR